MEKLPNYSLKNSHSSPHNEKQTLLQPQCQAQLTPNRALALSILSPRFQNVSGYAWHITESDIWVSALSHSQRVELGKRLACSTTSISPQHGWGRGCFTHFMGRDIDIPQCTCMGWWEPLKGVNPKYSPKHARTTQPLKGRTQTYRGYTTSNSLEKKKGQSQHLM